ncbi:MAG: hypothetical protein Q4E41_05260 [Bacteroidales bacterium]|nr:hypothetical protein [Bacteroidales bacterium]
MKKIFTFVFVAMMTVAAFAQDGSVRKVVTCYDMFDGKATPSGQEWTATLGEVTLPAQKLKAFPTLHTMQQVKMFACMQKALLL